jgi:photosystem II stability/assembly factor-like uncharacterized protein
MKTILTIAILLIFIQFCFAQDFWMQLEVPEDTGVYCIKGNTNGQTYLGARGFHISLDHGLNWNPTSFNELAVTIDIYFKTGYIYIGNHLGVFYSTDNGETWNSTSFNKNALIVFLSDLNHIYIGNWGGIHKSTNNGDTWTQTLEMSNAKEVASIIETADGNMFAGITAWSVPGGGVYCSMDNGDTWEHAGLWNHYIRSLATNSQGTLFAGSIGDGVGIYSSDNNGETWKGLKNDVFVTSIVVTPEDAIYIGCSNEHGTQGGVFRSLDNGETWEMINTGLIGWENQNVYGLTLSPDGYLYVYGNHLHRSVEPIFSINSIQQPDKCQTTIYPNPFTSNLNISISDNFIDSENTIVSIYDVLGNIVFKQRLLRYSNHCTLNTEFLNTGFYFLSIEENGKRYTKPIIKISR